ncbi:dephospho-CoA kinase-like isoform X2 [Daphnia pulex]|uniref:dephospho-CoA kinase-like isoform X2 n=1 Tax=Daphnia pulex TaxID=6669 RepID=UPI001EDCB00E|nr:dephospho-CoA kinase-like isoform X2 [Daphnia pulex]
MFLIGLTGGIASGKSTTANIFKEKQIPVIDADVFARLIVKPGQKAWNEIHKAFGNDVFLEDGQLNREALGKIIFADNNKRKILNKITHPKIQKMMFWAVIKYFFEGHKFVILDIPLLFETGTLLPFLHKIITVSCDQKTQLKRLMERDDYTETEANQRISSQMSLSLKCERSDFVVDNSATFGETRKQVEKIVSYFQASNHHVQVRIYLATCLIIFFCICGLLFFLVYKLLTR